MKNLRTALVALALSVSGLSACGGAAVPGIVAEPFHARYSVRGRWPGEREISYRIDSAGGPLAAREFHATIEAALGMWATTGFVSFRPAASGETPDLVLAWRRGPHAECTAFGSDPCLAHAGPVGPGTYVHFDAERAWPSALAMRQAALHELGHVLGLDHSDDPESVMGSDPANRRAWLGWSDLAALEALYGTRREPRDGDLVVRDARREVLLVLPMLAPGALTATSILDVDSDGDDEILLRRADEEGEASTWVFHFAPGPVLERVDGPLRELLLPLPSGLGSVGVGDLDGDGRLETVGLP